MNTEDLINVIGEKEAYANRISTLVKEVVSCYYNLPITAFQSKSRVRQVIKMKQTSVYFMKKFLPKATLIYIGKQMSYDHATVLHCLKQINNLLETDKETKQDIENIARAIEIEQDTIKLDGDLRKEYYYVNLGKCSSIKLEDGRGVVLSGYTEEQASVFLEMLNKFYKENLEIRNHSNTGLFILEKNT